MDRETRRNDYPAMETSAGAAGRSYRHPGQRHKYGQSRQGHMGYRWSHFVCVEIRDQSLKKELEKMQELIVDRYPDYGTFRTPSRSFHITVDIMSLRDDRDVRHCVVALESVQEEIAYNMRHCEDLKMQGIGSFGDKVIFAKVNIPRVFLKIRDTIIRCLLDANISCEDKRPYAPHVTLFKVPKSAAWNPRGSLNLQGLSDSFFGDQPVDNVQLCQMGETRHGFYRNIWGHWI